MKEEEEDAMGFVMSTSSLSSYPPPSKVGSPRRRQTAGQSIMDDVTVHPYSFFSRKKRERERNRASKRT